MSRKVPRNNGSLTLGLEHYRPVANLSTNPLATLALFTDIEIPEPITASARRGKMPGRVPPHLLLGTRQLTSLPNAWDTQPCDPGPQPDRQVPVHRPIFREGISRPRRPRSILWRVTFNFCDGSVGKSACQITTMACLQARHVLKTGAFCRANLFAKPLAKTPLPQSNTSRRKFRSLNR